MPINRLSLSSLVEGVGGADFKPLVVASLLGAVADQLGCGHSTVRRKGLYFDAEFGRQSLKFVALDKDIVDVLPQGNSEFAVAAVLP